MYRSSYMSWFLRGSESGLCGAILGACGGLGLEVVAFYLRLGSRSGLGHKIEGRRSFPGLSGTLV